VARDAPRMPGGRRDDELARLGGGTFDVLVIGAGALGAATAWHAAAAGARVAIVERGDLAGATSSASSKLVHGGLRYLAMGEIGLVREAHGERRLHAHRLAPHLVRPLEFVVPVSARTPTRLWRVRAGVFAYAALSRFRDGRSGRIGLDAARRRVPDLVTCGLDGAVLYHDHQTNDARLTLAALLDASAGGAVIAPHVELVGLNFGRGGAAAELRDRLGGSAVTVTARAVVNAAGPWVDRVRRLEDPRAAASVRLSKGAHLVLAGGDGWRAAVTTPLAGGRVSFAIPWEGMLLLGTTDEPYDGDPAAVAASDADQAQILDEAGASLRAAAVDPALVRSRFAGLRVLPLSTRTTVRTPRETVVSVGPRGMVSIAGGKLTTWRVIGGRAARLALRPLGTRPPAGRRPLPGAAAPAEIDRALALAHPGVTAGLRDHLGRRYGLLALAVLDAARDDPALLDPVAPGAPDVWAQVVHARDHEWAATADDVLRTRTTLALRGADTADVRAAVERVLGGGRP
jgi:glycerol-3-phosphate dehydrogenase